jgi:starch synthase
MRILLASSEVHPYAKTGGLADMVGALAKALGRAGHQVGVVTPLYRRTREHFPGLARLDWQLDLPLGPERVTAQVWTAAPSPNVTLYFIDQPRFYDRPELYTEGDADYADNAHRFIFFSKCVVHLARHLPFQPEILHTHDWQTGLVPLLVVRQQLTEAWLQRPHTCFTLHNLAYQGNFPPALYPLANLPPDYFHPNLLEFYGSFSCVKAGLLYADLITTVSPRYAREITTPEFGCGLDGVLRERLEALAGILNGVDYDEWNTTENRCLPHPYSLEDLSGKTADKLELQRELGLPVQPQVPLFANIGRLVDQKGHDLALGALEEMLAADIQFVLLGSGTSGLEQAYLQLARRFPRQIAVRIAFDPGLAHRLEAAADFFLMPSRFEPCGLNQMYSLRYGAIPIVRATGGLSDTVVDIAEDAARANGIKFTEYSAAALAKAIRKALALYGEPELLAHYRRNAMTADFSWDRTAAAYTALFRNFFKL